MSELGIKKKTIKNYFLLGIQFLRKENGMLILKFVNPMTLD
ncbi:MAG: hypothetical protein ACT4NJ_08290 [Nitrosopumilaceae archaeon]